MPVDQDNARPVLPETRRVAAVIARVRVDAGLSPDRAAEVTDADPDAVRAYEAGMRGVPATYVYALLRACGTPFPTFLDMLFASADWGEDAGDPAPLPPDATLLESALRMWRLQPEGIEAHLRGIVDETLAAGGHPASGPALALIRS
ncbi:hypothetical protein SAMN05216241_107109 [Limimonas halophila]|uniref:HTH cro/C1-type domain-containing protein n=1 Tax=Limimonas halophila TaxID=1082479 RepID=A0A1G7SQE6_9PROT|nr:helix-turn-helix transcriptional regulator [Limimonas halophila]SDG25317.1 hypothetical protein SAMN05216241_107109 [Limimonas halophila]